MTTEASFSTPRLPQPDRGRRWTRVAVAAVLAVTATVGGWMWWHGRQPAQRFARALAALDGKQFDEVRRELHALETTPGCEAQGHFLRGALLLQDARFFPALDEFGHTVDDPDLRLRTLTLSGQALYRVQNFPAAIGLLVQAVHAGEPSQIGVARGSVLKDPHGQQNRGPSVGGRHQWQRNNVPSS